jgi:hypothetical protein
MWLISREKIHHSSLPKYYNLQKDKQFPPICFAIIPLYSLSPDSKRYHGHGTEGTRTYEPICSLVLLLILWLRKPAAISLLPVLLQQCEDLRMAPRPINPWLWRRTPVQCVMVVQKAVRAHSHDVHGVLITPQPRYRRSSPKK